VRVGWPGIIIEQELQAANAFFDRVPRWIGRGRAKLLGQVNEQIAARHLWEDEVRLRLEGLAQLAAKTLHEHCLAHACRTGQHDRWAAVFHGIAQFQQRRLVRLAREESGTVCCGLEWSCS
jgi:hypothetical protein